MFPGTRNGNHEFSRKIIHETYLQAARMHLANLGRPVPPDLLQHLSPLGWQHINLTGDYLWTDPDAPSTALRPLRQMRAVEGMRIPTIARMYSDLMPRSVPF